MNTLDIMIMSTDIEWIRYIQDHTDQQAYPVCKFGNRL
jgi:hypothetical protein